MTLQKKKNGLSTNTNVFISISTNTPDNNSKKNELLKNLQERIESQYKLMVKNDSGLANYIQSLTPYLIGMGAAFQVVNLGAQFLNSMKDFFNPLWKYPQWNSLMKDKSFRKKFGQYVIEKNKISIKKKIDEEEERKNENIDIWTRTKHMLLQYWYVWMLAAIMVSVGIVSVGIQTRQQRQIEENENLMQRQPFRLIRINKSPTDNEKPNLTGRKKSKHRQKKTNN